MKELPATALLRPLGGDTLAITVWEATKESRFDTAALPALLIVAVGLVPVVAAIRLSRGLADRPPEADRTAVAPPAPGT
jgi:iron(III) transport system permease protein